MSQIWENREKKILGLIFSHFGQYFNIWSPKFFSNVLPLPNVKHCCKLLLHAISRKTNEANLKNSKKLAFNPDFDTFLPKYGPNFFFFFFLWLFALLDVMHCCKLSMYTISRKINEPNWENGKKNPSFGKYFCPFGPNLSPKVLFHGFYLY